MIKLILAAQSYGRSSAQNMDYSIIGCMAAIDKNQVSSDTPWDGANQIHYDLNAISDGDKITIADAIYDGRDAKYTVSSNDLIKAAWTLINDYGISQDAFAYIRGKTK